MLEFFHSSVYIPPFVLPGFQQVQMVLEIRQVLVDHRDPSCPVAEENSISTLIIISSTKVARTMPARTTKRLMILCYT